GRIFVVAEQAETGKSPAREIFEPDQRRNLFQFLGAHAAGISGANHRANTGSGYEINGYVLLFQNFQNANVGKPSGKPASKGNTNLRSGWEFNCRGRKWLGMTLEFASKRLRREHDLIHGDLNTTFPKTNDMVH